MASTKCERHRSKDRKSYSIRVKGHRRRKPVRAAKKRRR